MAQVVTNENMLEFIQNRQVPEFKAPEPTAEAKPETPEPKPEAPKAEPARDESGKFVAKEQAEAAPPEPKPAESEDPDDAELPERVRRQIGKKHRQMKEAEEFARDEARRAMAAEARAEELQRKLEALNQPKSQAPSDASDEPKPEDFKTVGEYAKAYTKWEVAQSLKVEREQAAKSRQQQAVQHAQDEFGKRVAEFAKTIPDYDEIVSQADVDVPQHIAIHIVESDVGPALGYHLAKNPDELTRLKSLSPTRAIAELGKLEMKLEKKPQPPAAAPQVSKAPAPIQPLEGKTTPVPKDPSQMSFQELRAYRQQQRSEGKYR